jgi:hypothetical protein
MKRAMFWNGEQCVKVVMLNITAEDDPMEVAQAWFDDADMQFPYTDIQVDEADYGNIDVSKTYKEISGSLLKAIWWLSQNGFTGKIVTDNTSKTEINVIKNGVEDTLTLTSATKNSSKVNILDYMKQFNKSFELKKEIERLKSMKGKGEVV